MLPRPQRLDTCIARVGRHFRTKRCQKFATAARRDAGEGGGAHQLGSRATSHSTQDCLGRGPQRQRGARSCPLVPPRADEHICVHFAERRCLRRWHARLLRSEGPFRESRGGPERAPRETGRPEDQERGASRAAPGRRQGDASEVAKGASGRSFAAAILDRGRRDLGDLAAFAFRRRSGRVGAQQSPADLRSPFRLRVSDD